MFKQRWNVASEIYETEKSYLKDLNILIHSFLQPLRDRKVVSESTLWKVFNEVTVLLDINAMLLMDLEQRIKNWHYATCIGDLFIERVRIEI